MTLLDVVDPSPVGRPTPPPTVLRGPADADHYRVQVGRYGERWYCDPLPGCAVAPAWDGTVPSVSGVKKASGSDWSYTAMKRCAELPDERVAALASMTVEERYEAFKAANKVGLNAAGKRGTNVHHIAESMLYGVPSPVRDGEPGSEYRGAVEAFFGDWQPELVAAEFVCIDRDLNGHGYGGTSDALVRIDGRLYLVDWKSRGADSAHAAYPEEAAQVAAYARAQYMIVEGDNGPERRNPPIIAAGLIVSIKPDGYRCYPIDLDAAHRHWSSLHAWWCARRDERAAIGRQWAAKKATPLPTPTPVADPLPTPPPVPVASQPVQNATDGHPSKADQRATVPASPDEGPDADPKAVDALRKVFAGLPDAERSRIGELFSQSQQAQVSFHLKDHYTVRRFEIARGLAWLRDAVHDDETLRSLVAYAVGDTDWPHFPSVTVGHVLGAMSATEAERFALGCEAIVAGRLSGVVEGGVVVLRDA